MFLFSLFITAQSYVLSLLFNSYTVVTGALFAFHFIMALAFNIGYNVVTFRAIDGRVSVDTVDTCFYVFNSISPQYPHYYITDAWRQELIIKRFGFVSTLQRLGGFIGIHQKEDTWYTMELVGFPLLMCTTHFFLWVGVLLLVEYRDQLAGKLKGEPVQSKIKYVVIITLLMIIYLLLLKDCCTISRWRFRCDSRENPFDKWPQFSKRLGPCYWTSQRVSNHNLNATIIIIWWMWWYPAPHGIKIAVKNLTLGIARGECFGLLGMNGAGKVLIN